MSFRLDTCGGVVRERRAIQVAAAAADGHVTALLQADGLQISVRRAVIIPMTVSPTHSPTVSPTAAPTASPSASPTTSSPSTTPTAAPSSSPTASPSASPSTASPTQWSEVRGVAVGVGYYESCGVYFDDMGRIWDHAEANTTAGGAFVVHTPGRSGISVLSMHARAGQDACADSFTGVAPTLPLSTTMMGRSNATMVVSPLTALGSVSMADARGGFGARRAAVNQQLQVGLGLRPGVTVWLLNPVDELLTQDDTSALLASSQVSYSRTTNSVRE